MKHLTKDELNGLLTVAERHDPIFALMILVTFNHGLRISEALALNAGSLVDGFLVVQRLKGSRKTTQPLLANERARIEARASESPKQLFSYSRMTAWRRMQAYGQEAGIPKFKLHPHILKHTTGRLGYEGGMGIPELQSYLGHVSGANTMVYLAASEEQASNAFAAAVGK